MSHAMTFFDIVARETSIPNSTLIKESKGERSETSCIADSRQTIIRDDPDRYSIITCLIIKFI